LIITGVVAFILTPKRPVYYLYLLLALAIGVRMAGPSVIERFSTSFVDAEVRDASAQSRVDLWLDCLVLMEQYPVFGVGPNHFPLVAPEFGWNLGKQAHSLWLQVGAEVGFPGLAFLLTFYLLTMQRLWRLSREFGPSDPESAAGCRMVIASLVGFIVAAQFVSLVGLELPYYITLVGASYVKLAYVTVPEHAAHAAAIEKPIAGVPSRSRRLMDPQ
jgi:O-antigen ligase